jgi:hypothetical protein
MFGKGDVIFFHLERGQGHVEPDAGPQVDDGLGADGGAAVRDLGLLHLAERSLHKNNIFSGNLFYETPFPPKTFRINFLLQSLDKFPTKNLHIHLCI